MTSPVNSAARGVAGTGRRPLAGQLRCAVAAFAIGFVLPVAGQPAGSPGTDEPGASQPAQSSTSSQPAQQDSQPSIAAALRPGFADPGGIRASLETHGITYSLTYIGEVLGNATGGIRRDANYQGRLDAQFDADLEKLLGLPGLVFHTNAYQIHGRGVSTCCLGGNLLTTSGIEAIPQTRIFEYWLEQKLAGDKVAIRAGQLAADTEFLVSQYAGVFVNATFGWPAITGNNLPNGGPAYPTATPGLRLKIAPSEGLTLMAAMFNGDPVGPNGPALPQRRDRSGFELRTTDPALLLLEGALTYGGGTGEALLPGTVKLGGWHHAGRFTDQRFASDGLSLADPSSSGLARRLRGDSGLYGVIDQLVYRIPDSDGGVGVFARLSGSPGDRNLISVYADGGVSLKGFVPGRAGDTLGIGLAYAQISGRARGLDRDLQAFGAEAATPPGSAGYAGPLMPVRSSEALVEATYQAEIVPGFTVQPTAQYVIRPGGNVSNPRDPNGAPIKNAAVFGMRASIRY